MKKMLCAFLAASSVSAFAGLEEKVSVYIPLEKDLAVITADGEKEDCASFKRATIARTPDFKIVEKNMPRFWKGGIYLEPGGRDNDRSTRNLLSAKEDPFDKTQGNAKAEKGLTPAAFAFSGSVQLKPVNLGITAKKYNSTHHVFSFYAKGKGTLKFVPVLTLNGNKQDLPAQDIALTDNWERYFVHFDCGDAKKLGENPVTTFSADFSAENAAIDAAMLETPAFYFNVYTPTTYVANGEFRDREVLTYPVITPESGMEGAMSCWFTLMGYGQNMPFFFVGDGWKRDLDLSYLPYLARGRMHLLFRGKDLYPDAPKLELNRRYHLLLNYTKNECTVYLDGKAIIRTATGAPAEFKYDKLQIGGSNMCPNNAVIEKVVIFNKALTPDEVIQAAAPDFPKLPVK